MSTKEKAATLFQQLSENDLELFISIFSRLYADKPAETDEQRLARKRAAGERIIARRPVLPPDFDEKQELLDYLDERYGNDE